MHVNHIELFRHLQYRISHETYFIKNKYMYNEIVLYIIQHNSYTMYTKIVTFYDINRFDP